MKVILNKRINQDLIKINQYKNLSFLSFLPSFSLPPSLPPFLSSFMNDLIPHFWLTKLSGLQIILQSKEPLLTLQMCSCCCTQDWRLLQETSHLQNPTGCLRRMLQNAHKSSVKVVPTNRKFAL